MSNNKTVKKQLKSKRKDIFNCIQAGLTLAFALFAMLVWYGEVGVATSVLAWGLLAFAFLRMIILGESQLHKAVINIAPSVIFIAMLVSSRSDETIVVVSAIMMLALFGFELYRLRSLGKEHRNLMQITTACILLGCSIAASLSALSIANRLQILETGVAILSITKMIASAHNLKESKNQ